MNRLGAYSSTPRLDAELLLAHILGSSRVRVLAGGRELLDPDQQAVFDALLKRRINLEPVAYLTGHKEFYGLDFLVDQRVLIPRPETELLIELALERARRTGPRSLVIADIGTGSGCIAVTLAAYLPGARVYAVDLSPEALQVAENNVARHGLQDRVHVLAGDLLKTLPEPVDVLVSNPPYTVLEAIDEGVRRHEPHLALDGGTEGLKVYRQLLMEAPSYLRPSGSVVLEIGAGQGDAVTAIARTSFPEGSIAVYPDLAGHDRVVTIDR